MVQTITPVVHGGRARWGRSVALHTLGATLSASALGAALGAAGAVLGAPWGAFGFAMAAEIASGRGISGSGAGVVVLTTVFGAAAVAKLVRPGVWRRALDGYDLGAVRAIAFGGMPMAELSVVALAASGSRRVAAWVAAG